MPALSLPISTRRLLAVTLLAVVAGVLVLRHLGASTASTAPALRVAPIRPVAPAERASRAGPLDAAVVDVEGAVRHPGLVRLPKGARVADAVSRAGGMTAKAERSGVNLAAPVADGQQVLVPSAGAAAGSAAAAGAATSGPISLNAATAEQLDTLPGIGPVTAQKIVAFREQHGPFSSVDGLDAIPGIGPARIASLRGLVVQR